MSLIADAEFISFFRSRAEMVANQTFDIVFKKVLNGDHETYGMSLELLQEFLDSFRWIIPTYVRLQNSPEIDENSQYFDQKENESFDAWKSKVLSGYAAKALIKDDSIDTMDFQFNYSCNSNQSLFSSYYSIGVITLMHNAEEDRTQCTIEVEIRKELFELFPWGANYMDFTLSKEHVAQNLAVLNQSIEALKQKGYEVEMEALS